jgi:hypothetical protein
MTANLLLSRGIVGTTFFSPPALADSDHHRGNAVLFALALMCRPALFLMEQPRPFDVGVAEAALASQ